MIKKLKTAQVDELFSQWDKHDSPGCALMIIQNGKIIYQRGYGMANLEYDIPISPNSVFEIASNSKQFTATCIILLARQNLLTLDDELQKYIPEMPQYSHPITLRHLIHHTSGIRDYIDLINFAGIINEHEYSDEEAIGLIARQQSLNFQPGTEQLYSNSGYFLLGEIIKRVSGKSLRVFAEEHIFTPLGMKNTHCHDNFREIVRNRANGYAPKEGGGFEICMSLRNNIGASSIYTTIEDLFLWDQNFYKDIILGDHGQDLIEEITTLGKLMDGEVLSQFNGAGLTIGKYRGLKMTNHGGLWQGYHSDMVRFPDRQFSVICLANLSTFNPTKLSLQVADIYLEHEFTEVITKPISRSVESTNPSLAELEARTGFYHNPTTNNIWELEIKDEKLTAKVVEMYFQLISIDATHFQSIDSTFNYDIDIDFPGDLNQMIARINAGKGIEIFTLQKMLASTPQGLTDYIGTYYSTELESDYRATSEGNKLFIKGKGYPPFHLRPISQDSFLAENDQFEFIRDEDNLIIGFNRCGNRVRQIHFIKQ